MTNVFRIIQERKEADDVSVERQDLPYSVTKCTRGENSRAEDRVLAD